MDGIRVFCFGIYFLAYFALFVSLAVYASKDGVVDKTLHKFAAGFFIAALISFGCKIKSVTSHRVMVFLVHVIGIILSCIGLVRGIYSANEYRISFVVMYGLSIVFLVTGSFLAAFMALIGEDGSGEGANAERLAIQA